MDIHTQRGKLRGTFRAATLGGLLLLSTGCILRLTGGFAFTNDLGTFIDFIFEDVSTAYCRDLGEPELGMSIIECEYSIATGDGSSQRTSTAQLLSQFGVFGIIVDPVIVQVPASATFGLATVDDGGGPQDLRITETTSFTVTPGVQSTAQPGQKFWIIELPAALEATLPTQPNSVELDYRFQYNGPPEADGFATFRVLYAGRVDLNGESFYLPMYPCTADFSQIPDIDVPAPAGGTFPLAGFIFDLLFRFGFDGPGELGNLGCTIDQVYDFRPAANAPPQVDAGPALAIDEGADFVSAGSFTDPDSTTWTAIVDYGESAPVQTLPLNPDGSFALNNRYDDNGVFTVTVTVTDDSGASGTASTLVTVANVAPSVDAGPPTTIDEGERLLSAGSFSDPGADTWTATVDYGEGDGPQTLPLNADGSFVLDNVYEDDGTFTVVVTVTDDDGETGVATTLVTVNPVTAPPLACDVDRDGDVDRDDLGEILQARNQAASGPDDPRDNDGDGRITVLDARQCVLLCTRLGCAR